MDAVSREQGAPGSDVSAQREQTAPPTDPVHRGSGALTPDVPAQREQSGPSTESMPTTEYLVDQLFTGPTILVATGRARSRRASGLLISGSSKTQASYRGDGLVTQILTLDTHLGCSHFHRCDKCRTNYCSGSCMCESASTRADSYFQYIPFSWITFQSPPS